MFHPSVGVLIFEPGSNAFSFITDRGKLMFYLTLSMADLVKKSAAAEKLCSKRYSPIKNRFHAVIERERYEICLMEVSSVSGAD